MLEQNQQRLSDIQEIGYLTDYMTKEKRILDNTDVIFIEEENWI